MTRDLNDLLPDVKAKADAFLAACTARGYEMVVVSVYRSFEEQDGLYAQGRTAPGKIVTNARGGQSWHNFRRAFDAVPKNPDGSGNLWWDCPMGHWVIIYGIAGDHGLECGGQWPRFKDLDHFQDTGGMTLAQALAEHNQQQPAVLGGQP